jgi:tellurite resistance protein
MAKLRQADPGFATQVLEDRAALLFWKWVEAQVLGDASRVAKVASEGFQAQLRQELEALGAQGRRRLFLDCALGAVDTRRLTTNGADVAAVELRWSAKMALVPKDARTASAAVQPQRSVLLLERKAGAKSSEKHGLSTNRCPNCSAPLTDNGQPTCEFCGAALASGELDWVIREFVTWEHWLSNGGSRPTQRQAPMAARVPDREERERLVYLMASMARADGVVEEKERALLRTAAERWGVPWANVELALNAGDGLFDRLITRGSVEAQSFMHELLQVALIDGRIDRKERKLLEAAAKHLGVDPAVIDARR